MPAGLTPLSAVTGFTIQQPEASREALSGGTTDPRHAGIPHDNGQPIYAVMPDEIKGPYGLENDLMGMDLVITATSGHGELFQDPTADLQPVTHGAPWPGGVPSSPFPEDMQDRHDQVTAIRSLSNRMGGEQEMQYIPTATPVNADWKEIYSVEPGSSLQVPIPQQVQTGSGGFGSRDRVQSQARQNEYGFGSAHLRGRYPTDGLVGNNMWMDPASRPMRKGIAGPAIVPVGDGSPFAGQVPGEAWNTEGAALQDLPVAYKTPPQPGVQTSYETSGNDAVVDYF